MHFYCCCQNKDIEQNFSRLALFQQPINPSHYFQYQDMSIKYKSDVFSVLSGISSFSRKKNGQTIGTLQSAQGGETTISERLEPYLRAEGIQQEMTVRSAHQ